MSNLARAVEFVQSNPSLNRADYISKFMEMFNTNKGNATCYLYNAQRKIANGVATKMPLGGMLERGDLGKRVVAARSSKTPVEIEEIKAKNLETMKKISKKVTKRREYLEGQVAKDDVPGVENFDPIIARAEVDAILNDQGLVQALPKFLQD